MHTLAHTQDTQLLFMEQQRKSKWGKNAQYLNTQPDHSLTKDSSCCQTMLETE